MSLIQRSFSGGELSPSLYARADTVKYQTGLRTMRNHWTRRDGGSQNRPGSEFIAEVRDSESLIRIIPFVFNNDQTYLLEFSDQYVRIYQDGSPLLAEVTGAKQNVTGVSLGAQCTINLADSSALTNGDEVYFLGVGGTSELNGNFYIVSDLASGEFKIKDHDGSYIDSSAFTAFTSGGTVQRAVGFVTDYVEDDLMELQYAQSADVLTITHNSYPPQEIIRAGAYSWSIDEITFGPDFESGELPAVMVLTQGANGTASARYAITVVDRETGDESYQGVDAFTTISGATKANPCVLTIVDNGFTSVGADEGQLVFISGVAGMTELNGRYYRIIEVVSGTSIKIDVDSTDFGTYTSDGIVWLTSVIDTTTAPPTESAPNVLTWDQTLQAKRDYNIYKEVGGLFQFVGSSYGPRFLDIGQTPDPLVGPPVYGDEFITSDMYPACCAYMQQRLLLANFTSNTEKLSLSRVGRYKNFSKSTPLTDDSAFNFSIAGRQVNAIKHMIDIGELIIFTAAGEWSASGNSNGALAPGAVNLKQHTYYGSGRLPPIVLNGNALYVQARGSIVRDLGFDYQIDGYRGNDLTTFSAHLFEGFSLYDWTYQQVPHSIVWAARSDGVLLGLTYVREQQILAWHHHDFENGFIESVCAIPEGDEDALYLVVRRTIDGVAKKYIERLTTRQIDDIVDAKFMDSCISYDGRNTDTTHTMTLSGGTTWANTETLTITSSASYFTAAEVGNQIHLNLLDDDDEITDTIRFTLNAYTSPTVMTGKAHKTVPANMRVALSSWSRAVDSVSGLAHLEGEDVSVLADGFVVSSPHNAAYPTLTVVDGAITLPRCYAVIHVGLPITSDLETLDIDTPDTETLSDKNKLVSHVTCFLEKTRGGFVGAKAPSGDDPLENLIEFKPRSTESLDEPPDLKTGSFELGMLSEWNSHGRIFIRHVDPLPMSVLALVPAGLFTGGG